MADPKVAQVKAQADARSCILAGDVGPLDRESICLNRKPSPIHHTTIRWDSYTLALREMDTPTAPKSTSLRGPSVFRVPVHTSKAKPGWDDAQLRMLDMTGPVTLSGE